MAKPFSSSVDVIRRKTGHILVLLLFKMNAARITIHLNIYAWCLTGHVSLTESFSNLVFRIYFMTLSIKLISFDTVPLRLLL